MEKPVNSKRNITCIGYSPNFLDFLIINIPAFTALTGSIAAFNLACFFSSRFIPFFWVLVIIGWQAVCATVMLFIDYFIRKRYVFQRIQALYLARSSSLERSLNLENTFCGITLKLAVTRRRGRTAVNHILEEEYHDNERKVSVHG